MTASRYDGWATVAEQFGVDIEQVRRDHLISHMLAAIAADVPTDDVVFFGGTALSRTHLTDARLSEDIDLIALAPRTDVAVRIEAALWRGLARSHGRPTSSGARATSGPPRSTSSPTLRTHIADPICIGCRTHMGGPR
ncbi:nucleotidyl transferase AbiEii/AbiGii toxin family protein [Actinotalea sp. K2]|uniref:nucleotidyl transferase AbiEii/AbiGii toxin family protein n=1 Tax=Actinotalea sp. K2 TaxID=2939438 RepID=UPI002016E758|nr:nucleotidyl transferase AbiEii/AbiGii toxin family protein [Actinotalea sp. K2]MCL3862533.1 nucleotidyl transferase AbiEii/AbiGii toxin family protein [Actinotalea sp. K2]